MSNFEIVRGGERINDIISGGETVARVINGADGWLAYRVVKTGRVNAMGPVYEVTGDGIRSNKFINRPDAAAAIAQQLGLE